MSGKTEDFTEHIIDPGPAKKTKGNSLVKSGAMLSLLTLMSRILGLIREAVKGAFLGTTALADAFTISFMIPNLLRRLFAENSISVAFIPTFKEYLEEDKKNACGVEGESTREFLSSFFTLLTFLVSLTVVIGILITPLIVPVFGTISDESILLTRIMFPYLFFISLAAFFQGILNGVKVFSPSGFTPVLFNSCVIIFTLLLHKRMENPARAMALGVVVGGAVQCFFQLPFILRRKIRFSFVSLKKAFCNKGTRTVLKLIAPTIIGMAAYQLNDVVSSALAGHSDPGVVSSLQYSLRIQELILGIFAVSIGTVLLPDLTSYAYSKQWEDFNSTLKKSMNIIALITIPVTFYCLLLGENIISLIFQGHAFSRDSVNLTMDAFVWHISGLYFIALNRIIAPAFYAQKDTKSPTVAGIISFAVNIGVAVLLAGTYKGKGIAFALSFASFTNTIALFFYMKKNRNFSVGFLIKDTILYGLKMILFSLIASVPVYFLKPIFIKLGENFSGSFLSRVAVQGIPVLLSALVFACAGIFLLVITKDSVFIQAKKMILRGKKK